MRFTQPLISSIAAGVLLLFGAGCAKKAPAPPPAAIIAPVAAPNWGHPTKETGCAVGVGIQDHGCTPGDIIAANTKAVICAANFSTTSVRDSVTTPTQKEKVYGMYNIPHPSNNSGANQKCEIDHLVSLELGGNDTMANLWPQCSPGYQGQTAPGFRDKDKFENYLHRQVCAGKIALPDAQRQIATDWLKFWTAAGKPTK
jgi:hypothetical protein